MEMLDYILDPSFVVTVLAAIAAFATVWSIISPFFETDKLDERMKAVTTRREELKQRQREELTKKSNLRRTPQGLVKKTVDDLNLQNLLQDKTTKMRLLQAGLRGPAPLYTFMFFRLIMPPIVFGGALFYLFVVDSHGYDAAVRAVLSIVAGFVGFYMPNVFLQNMIAKRQEAIVKAFPDCLDLLLICIESGMSIEAAFNKVAEEIASQSIELAEEMSLTTAELSYLGDRRQALENLALRTGIDGVKAVTTALAQAERYGTPLGQALRVMAQENRDERMAMAEKKAAALPAKLTVPMIAFFLPVLFVVILGPAILKVMNM